MENIYKTRISKNTVESCNNVLSFDSFNKVIVDSPTSKLQECSRLAKPCTFKYTEREN